MLENIKFKRNDLVRINVNKFIENSDKEYYIILGKPSKIEQTLLYREFDVSIDIMDRKVNSNEKIKLEKLLNTTIMNVAIHIYETNMAELKSIDDKIEFIKELDKSCPELIDYLTEEIAKLEK